MRVKALRPRHLHRGRRSPARRTTADGTFVRRIRGAACSLSTSAATRGAFLGRRGVSTRETSGWIAAAVRTFAQAIMGPASPAFPGILPLEGATEYIARRTRAEGWFAPPMSAGA